MAEHQRQRSSCPFYIPRVCAAVRGERWGDGQGSCRASASSGVQFLAFACPAWLPVGTVGGGVIAG